jgi:hypothetical protein
MPNWCHNSLVITHPDVDKVNALEKFIKDQPDAGNDNPELFNFLRPRPEAENENWYSWNNSNWGTKWDACDLNDFKREDNKLSFTFNTAWSPPKELYSYLCNEDWELLALYYERGNGFCGIYDSDDYGDAEWELPHGRRNCRRMLEDDDMPEILKDFIDLEEMIQEFEEEAEDDEDYKSEYDGEEEDELDDNLPITEASRIIATETPKLIKGYKEYCKHLLATAWKIYLKQHSDMYDEKWFAIIGVEKIYETINWKWVVEQTNARVCND